MQLQKIYVLPDHQGSGIGTVLLKEVQRVARKINPDYIWLDTPVSNENVVRLYQRNGFQKMRSYFLTIGTQTFEYYLVGLPVTFKVTSAY